MFVAVPPEIVPTLAPESELGDRASRGRDRRAAVLGMHPRVRGAPVKGDLERLRVRRTEDHNTDRSRLVVDVAGARTQPGVVEGVRTDEPDLLLGREQQLDAGVWPALSEDQPGGLEHGGDGCLVVGAEDRARGVPNDPVLDDGLDRGRRRHSVEVGAEQQWFTRRGRLDPRVQVAAGRADPRAASVFLDVEAAVAQVPDHEIRNRTLFAWRARDCGELREQIEDVRRQRKARRLRRRCGHAPAAVRHRRTRGTAAPAASAAT
jgi:hypothetical protein